MVEIPSAGPNLKPGENFPSLSSKFPTMDDLETAVGTYYNLLTTDKRLTTSDWEGLYGGANRTFDRVYPVTNEEWHRLPADLQHIQVPDINPTLEAVKTSEKVLGYVLSTDAEINAFPLFDRENIEAALCSRKQELSVKEEMARAEEVRKANSAIVRRQRIQQALDFPKQTAGTLLSITPKRAVASIIVAGASFYGSIAECNNMQTLINQVASQITPAITAQDYALADLDSAVCALKPQTCGAVNFNPSADLASIATQDAAVNFPGSSPVTNDLMQIERQISSHGKITGQQAASLTGQIANVEKQIKDSQSAYYRQAYDLDVQILNANSGAFGLLLISLLAGTLGVDFLKDFSQSKRRKNG